MIDVKPWIEPTSLTASTTPRGANSPPGRRWTFTKDEVYRIYLPYRRSAGRRDPARAVSSPSVGKQAAVAEELGTVRDVLVRSLRELRESGLIVPAGRGRWSVADRDAPASLALDDRAT